MVLVVFGARVEVKDRDARRQVQVQFYRWKQPSLLFRSIKTRLTREVQTRDFEVSVLQNSSGRWRVAATWSGGCPRLLCGGEDLVLIRARSEATLRLVAACIDA